MQNNLPEISLNYADIPIPRTRFRSRALAAVIILNAVAILTVMFGLSHLRDRDIRQAEIHSRNLSLAMDMTFSNEIGKIDLSLQTVSREIQSAGTGKLDRTGIQRLVAHQKALLKETESWTISDANGQVIISEGNVKIANPSIADRSYFNELKRGSKSGLVMSTPVTSRLSAIPVVVFMRDYRDDSGHFAGVVATALPLSYFKTLLSGFDVGAKGSLALRGADLGLVIRVSPGYPDGGSIPGDRRVTAPFEQFVHAGIHAGTFHSTTPFDQVERIVSFRKLDVAPLYVLVGISKNDFLTDWRHLCWVTVGFLILFLFITDVSAILLYRQWRQQRLYVNALNVSNEKLKVLLQKVQERDVALLSAQEAGELGTYSLDIPTGIWTNSQQLDTIFGIDAPYPRTLDGWQRLIHAEDRVSMLVYFEDEVIGKGRIFDREYRIVRPIDGKERWVHGLGKLAFDEQGRPLRMSGTIQDISERKFHEARLHLSQEVFQSASEGIMVTDRSGTIIEINPAFTKITGYSHEEAVGLTPRILKSGAQTSEFYQQMWQSILKEGRWEGEFVNRRKNGEIYVQHTRISAILDHGELSRFTALISDITELKQSQRQLEYLAYYDKLTELPNRVLLAERIQQAIDACQGQDQLLGVCYIDLDLFKPVNDEWGHELGDRLLIEVAKRLKQTVRAEDTVARMGGDEFVVLFSGCTSRQELEAAAHRILASQCAPYQLDEFRSALTMSIGVTYYPNDMVDDADTLIRHADQAMYEAKRNGKNRIHFYDLDSARSLREHQQQYARMVEALARHEFRLHYQPKIDMRNGMVAGVEALIRWQHPEQGLLPPGQFLPVIESTELTVSVGEWILHEVLQQKRRWTQDGVDLPVSINIFGLHLQRPDFVERLEQILATYPDIDPGGLELEILETTAMEDLGEISDRIHRCRALGVRFSLDDFGTGYSSLTYFRQLPVDIVKIDRSFVIGMLDNENDRALVESIIGMTHMLKRTVVAEGVETLEHCLPLLRYGCDFAQGYGIARPMPPERLPDWLHQWKPAEFPRTAPRAPA